MKTHNLFITAVFTFCLIAIPHAAVFANGLSFSVTPTIFDMAAMPGQAWNSAVKVVNNNPYELTIYATPVNFVPQGERGHGAFLPISDTDDAHTLAEWMDVSSEPFVIPAESSVGIPVNISVPQDASPGGHYAAIMIGTRPPIEDGKVEIKTSQIITSLFFVRIAGDVIERGEVRTFRTGSWFAGKPEMSFEVRFENKGNVHLIPRGEIKVLNMWGKERGIIPINHETNFGNVLPESTRQFDFTWRGDTSLADIGRYKAELTLAYGQEEQKFVTRAVGFWVIPVKPVLIFLLGFALAAWLITRSVRAYVRYMLRMSGIDPDQPNRGSRPRYVLGKGDVRIEQRSASPVTVVAEPVVAINAPVWAGFIDLKARLKGVHANFDMLRVLWRFVLSYPRFFMSALGFIVLFVVVWSYLASVTTKQRDYEVTIDSGNQPVTLSSEEIMRDATPVADAPASDEMDAQPTDQAFTLKVVNASDTPGVGGSIADDLTSRGYRVDTLTAELDDVRPTTAIVYDPRVLEEAKILSDIFDNAPISAYTDPSATNPGITVFIGNDVARGE